jgi:hypothetical protein
MGDDACWVLVEFKSWANLGQYAEQRKPKSRKLCSELKKNNDARALHDRGHFAGYGVGIGMKFNIYRNHFCGGFDGDDNREQSDRAFLDAFYDRAVGLTPELADIYIRWLMDLDSDKTTTEIRRLKLLVDTGQDQVMIRSFASAAEASNWISDLQSWRSQPSPGSGSSTSPKP